jgi:polyphosphate kinase 2 (PPK2 family)
MNINPRPMATITTGTQTLIQDTTEFSCGRSASISTRTLQEQMAISRKDYKAELHDLQVEFVKLQRHLIAHGDRILVLLEGRDSAGKDGSIKRVVAHLSPRETRVVALGKPSDRDTRAWYFQGYVEHLPVAEELVLLNRSWYNRAGVERVMRFCTKA